MHDTHDPAQLGHSWAARRRSLLVALGALPLLGARPARAALPPIEVYRNPSCGCCGGWVEHMRSQGFGVQVHEVADTAAVRARLGLDAQFGSCHTATVAGYVIEGHVPAADVKRLLEQRPVALGLAVPGMPAGSPGMASARPVPYEVLLVQRGGRSSVFNRYP